MDTTRTQTEKAAQFLSLALEYLLGGQRAVQRAGFSRTTALVRRFQEMIDEATVLQRDLLTIAGVQHPTTMPEINVLLGDKYKGQDNVEEIRKGIEEMAGRLIDAGMQAQEDWRAKILSLGHKAAPVEVDAGTHFYECPECGGKARFKTVHKRAGEGYGAHVTVEFRTTGGAIFYTCETMKLIKQGMDENAAVRAATDKELLNEEITDNGDEEKPATKEEGQHDVL